jgi:tetratricopeptide (TPR) repeat protein
VDLTTDLLRVLSASPSTPENAQQEIILRTSLARAMLATKGYTPEVEQAYTRALELSLRAEDSSQLFPVLRALFSFYTFRAEFDKGFSIGEQILSLAERSGDANMRIEGHFILGCSYGFTGDTLLGLEHLEKGISYIDPERPHSGRFRLGNYAGVSCYITSSLLLWGLGFPDRALQRANAAVALAKKINHPYSQAYALYHIGYLHFWRRETALSLEWAQETLDFAEQHEFQIWKAVGACLQGAGLASAGRAEEGLAQIQRGMDKYQALKSPPIFWPLLRTLQAGACGQAGKPEQGLALLDEVMRYPGQGYGRVLMLDAYLLKGNLLLRGAPDKTAEAEVCFQQGLEIAQEQGALMLELRLAISLTRLWWDTGKGEEGRRLLSEVYTKFTEGFTTPDLIEARELLRGSMRSE